MPSPHHRSVLLINDHGQNRSILKELLLFRGYDVLESEDVDNGIRLARTRQPAVVVSEFLIPYRDGRCVVEELRIHPETATTAVIIFTANVFPEARERAERAGGIFLAKPARPSDVCALIEEIAPPPPASRTDR
jgi:CheY-like chemotaxis protein